MGIEYLTEVDAFLLGYDIDKNDVRLIDNFSYQLNLAPIIKTLTLRYKSECIKLRDILSNKGQLKLELGFENEEEYKERIRWLITAELCRKDIESYINKDNVKRKYSARCIKNFEIK